MPTPKPISEKQLAANRRNAKRSTGPSTATGRQTVSLNSLRHGLTSPAPVLPAEDLAAHQTFCRELIEEMAPANATELDLAQAISCDLWRLNRARALEDNIFALGILEDDPDPDHDPDTQLAMAGARTFLNHIGKFNLLSIYEQRINRTLHKNREMLRNLQMERSHATQLLLEEMILERAAAERAQSNTAPRNPQVIDFPTPPPSNGFAYANKLSGPPRDGLTLVKAA